MESDKKSFAFNILIPTFTLLKAFVTFWITWHLDVCWHVLNAYRTWLFATGIAMYGSISISVRSLAFLHLGWLQCSRLILYVGGEAAKALRGFQGSIFHHVN